MAGNSCFMSTASENSMLTNAERERERDESAPERDETETNTRCDSSAARDYTTLTLMSSTSSYH